MKLHKRDTLAKKNSRETNYDGSVEILKDEFAKFKGSRDEGYLNYKKNWGRIPESVQDSPAVPYQIDIDVADACNLNCYYCFDRSRKRTGKVMSEESIKSLLKQLKIYPVYALDIGFVSEPLLRFDLIKRIFDGLNTESYVTDLFIHTNGILMNEEVSRYLIKRKVSMVNVSPDAGTKETYKRISGSDDFDKVVDNIKRLRYLRDSSGESLPKIRTSMVMVKENIHEKNVFYETWKDIADKIEFQRCRNVYLKNKPGKEFSNKVLCPWPFMRMSIWPDGRIGVCPYTGSLAADLILPFFIQDSDIKEVWNSQELLSIRSRMFGKGIDTCFRCHMGFIEPLHHAGSYHFCV